MGEQPPRSSSQNEALKGSTMKKEWSFETQCKSNKAVVTGVRLTCEVFDKSINKRRSLK